MSDRHLCKAKRTDNGEWVEGNYFCRSVYIEILGCKDIIVHHYIIPIGIEVPEKATWEEVCVEIDPSTICQCTGLPDKNRKTIWENDKCCVRRFCILAYGVIKYLEGCFCFVEDRTGNILRLCDIRTNGYEIKVEGNIFDNPELLKGINN